VILGASPDTVAKQAKFKKKYELPFTLVADEEHTLAEAYGVWQQKSFMGKKFMGVVRTTYLIDPQGKVARTFEGVKPAGHATEVAEALQEIQSR
jgi:peroxiredoxin Q/BCP